MDPLGAQQSATVPDIPPVASSSGADAPASAAEDLSYPDRLGGGAAAREVLREAPATPPEPAARRADAPAATPAPPASDVPGEPAGDGFAIQLAALGKREEAAGIVRRLAGKGYSAYLMAPPAGAPAVYRVRVGKFKDRREAESVSARLQKEEQFKPWIVR
jgi:cell division septation protein DedD